MTKILASDWWKKTGLAKAHGYHVPPSNKRGSKVKTRSHSNRRGKSKMADMDMFVVQTRMRIRQDGGRGLEGVWSSC